MGDVRGQVFALSVLAGIVGGRELELRERIEAFGDGESSPIARLPGTHFARFVLLPDLARDVEPGAPGRDEPRWLLFTSTFDGPLEPWLDELRERIAAEAEQVFGCCEGFPGCADREGFHRWMRAHKLKTSAFAAAYPEATVAQVREAVARRQRLRELAVEAAALDNAGLQAAFRRAFPGRPRQPG